MPKAKTHRGAAKRFKATASGRLRRKKACASHLLGKKSSSRKRRLRAGDFISSVDKKRIGRLLPNI
ncbi:MAG: 50S ribosomal protein L35 [Thermodesulfobacteriota bacterium]